MSDRYHNSEQLLERALKSIPLGSQTFSKSITQYPKGVSPFFIERAKGSQCWDIDGNAYLDFVSALCCVSLGYGDPEVDQAIRDQLDNGISFSLPHRLECEVAERIIDMVPCAEKVRFAKNGTDATSGAVRLARAFTGRVHIAVCGYHGWQDWYISTTTKNLGIPESTRKLTHTFDYNDLASLQALFDQQPKGIAAVVMEPMNVAEPAEGFLEGVKSLCERNGALLIFDETITGFRFAKGGAQEHFGVTPDLATFGKALANGMPLSAVTGRSDVMNMMEHVFLSGTFGGETLSLAASKAVLDKLQREPVIETLYQTGASIQKGIVELARKYECENLISTSGKPCWSFLNLTSYNGVSPWELKTLFLQEVFKRGVLTLGAHNVTYAHSSQDIEKLLSVYDEVFPILKDACDRGNANEFLLCAPLKPLFKVR
ncbi:aminotransferase class III-fold pyridoxal phosphate-dependent enzyme [Pseudovibrio sp. JE062]|uniref:aminotransferase class III-fold pyridoxal phosphate-dependent enzyme n=1 Tax=Pseudovibrio sp. JE062 TaxID=439495 RepID=UPI000186F658|nr:aminotransferase class III-fold pyridoxal phosphate-dependent enzyme [Pseudovibrio sp. JE062]EEA93402.1 glutamate-1-semialdehyde 2,1-aminomutase [Pseudovibrio sp. JE062]